MKTYLTSFCNRPHALQTGKPIGHECRILPPSALQAERDGDVERAIEILRKHGEGPIVNGRAPKRIRITVVCQECGKRWTVGPNSDPQCPKCNSVDYEVAE